MVKFRLPCGLLLIATLPAFGQQQPLVTFESPTVCLGAHGVWRWAAKNDTASPPDTITPDHHIKPSDIAAWDDLDREVKGRSPRFGREKEWFALTGRVAGVKAEEDGDLHIELRDADNPYGVRVVVEVPLDHHGGKTPWNPIRQTVFGWNDQKFHHTFLGPLHRERNHQGLGNRLIEPGPEVGRRNGRIDCHERLGGLLRYYYRAA
jgi:hypothetical protein